MDEILEDLGLTKLEIKIYKMLLNEGSSLAGDISKRTGIHRRNVYDALERLIHKGLVGYIKENNTKKYSISDPQIVHNQLLAKQKEFEKALPEIIKKYNTITEKKETLFFRGKQGLKLIFDDQIKVGKEILVNATTAKVSDVLKYYFPKYQLLRKQNKIKIRMLFDASYQNNPREVEGILKLPLCEARFLKNFNKSPMSQYIYGDNVALVVWSENPIAILIRQKEIAEGFRDSFELMWKIAK